VSNIEEHIRRAMQEGKFDNLPGKGKPLRLDDNPHQDPAWRLAHHVLRENGFALPWMESLRAIETQLEAARTALLRAWSLRQAAGTGAETPAFQAESQWRRAVKRFHQQIEEINQLVAAYNLEVPLDRFQKRRLDAGREITRLTAPDPSDKL
jgi:DnaJ family protein C protein 28